MKKLLSVGLLVLGMAVPTFAQPINVNGVITEVETKNIKYTNFVPLRQVSELLGYSVKFVPNTSLFSKEKLGTIIVNNGDDMVVTFGVGEIDADVKKKTPKNQVLGYGRTCDPAPFIDNGVTYVPIRAVAEILENKVDYVDGVIMITEVVGE